MTSLFTPINIGQQTLDNRIVIPPMCQYSAVDGKATDWHLMHYGQFAQSGAGLMIIEATSICPEGRLSPYDLGLWNDETESSMKGLIQSIRRYSDMPIGIQLVHAGRKASMCKPWQGTQYITPEQGGWQTVAPSAIPFSADYNTPLALSLADIAQIVQQFAEAARRADRAGLDMIELHAAHGYLLHQFLSPISNQRQDQYGGSLDNRMRLILEVYQAVRQVFPAEKAVGIRISATDWVEGGWDLEQSIALAKALDALGCSYIHVSTGGLSDQQKIPVGPNYQVPFAQGIKQHVSMPTIAVGLITESQQAEAIIATGQADMIAVGRGMIFNPHWPWKTAAELGQQVTISPQYERSKPHGVRDLFKLFMK